MAENFRHGVPEDLSGWMLKRNRVMPTKKKRYFKLAAQVLSSHVKDVRFLSLGGEGGVALLGLLAEAAVDWVVWVCSGPGGGGADMRDGRGVAKWTGARRFLSPGGFSCGWFDLGQRCCRDGC